MLRKGTNAKPIAGQRLTQPDGEAIEAKVAELFERPFATLSEFNTTLKLIQIQLNLT